MQHITTYGDTAAGDPAAGRPAGTAAGRPAGTVAGRAVGAASVVETAAKVTETKRSRIFVVKIIVK